MQNQANPLVLVTGATGYISSHLIKILLENGYRVRGTVRSLANKEKYEFLYSLVPEKSNNIELVEAELTTKDGWDSAVEGCEYVFHMASPLPAYVPKDENEIIVPAVQGTMNVLEAAVAKGVKRAVVTSSTAAITYGNEGRPITEEDWSKEEACGAYPKSKVRAEKAAWKLYEDNKDKFELATVAPGLVLGPINKKAGSVSEIMMSDILAGRYPGVVDITYNVVDVRDVAMVHYKAMFTEAAKGRRYICINGPCPIERVIKTLKSEFTQHGYEIPDKYMTAEDVVAHGNPNAQRHISMIGKKMEMSNEKSRTDLGITYRPFEETILDMGHSLIKHGVVEDKISRNQQ